MSPKDRPMTAAEITTLAIEIEHLTEQAAMFWVHQTLTTRTVLILESPLETFLEFLKLFSTQRIAVVRPHDREITLPLLGQPPIVALQLDQWSEAQLAQLEEHRGGVLAIFPLAELVMESADEARATHVSDHWREITVIAKRLGAPIFSRAHGGRLDPSRFL